MTKYSLLIYTYFIKYSKLNFVTDYLLYGMVTMVIYYHKKSKVYFCIVIFLS